MIVKTDPRPDARPEWDDLTAEERAEEAMNDDSEFCSKLAECDHCQHRTMLRTIERLRGHDEEYNRLWNVAYDQQQRERRLYGGPVKSVRQIHAELRHRSRQ